MNDTKDPTRCVVCGVRLNSGDVDWTATCGSDLRIVQHKNNTRLNALIKDTMFNYKVLIVLTILHGIEGVWALWHTLGAR